MDRDTITRTGARATGVGRRVRMTALRRDSPPDTELEHGRTDRTARRAEANRVVDGKAPPEMSALKPYWGKPAVRNFREGDGNNGIIEARSAPSPYSTAETVEVILTGLLESLLLS